ncbi:hypothetical protein JTE90_007735 [Oedothorax gibbosus]|uniref:Uncharacterized protein n=1 Tax=Oedothorax gibbosus TaxID=931172 RepID=A0AAV6V5H2_9ARAC|nr:hypothetical protein JTE90_007735 [Oedothorax gibbosus]
MRPITKTATARGVPNTNRFCVAARKRGPTRKGHVQLLSCIEAHRLLDAVRPFASPHPGNGPVESPAWWVHCVPLTRL